MSNPPKPMRVFPESRPPQRRRGAGRAAAVCLGLLAAMLANASPAPAQPASQPAGGDSSAKPASAIKVQVVEGFERLSSVHSWPGKLEAVTEGEGVTEGLRAARIPGGQTVGVKLHGEECRQYVWLKIDVLTLQPLSQPFCIVASAPNWERRAYAYAQSGKDTLAMPMALFFQQGSPDEVELDVINVSDRAVILDNIRLETAAAPPAGCLAIHFGWDGHPVWPGFSSAGTNCPQIVWSGKVGIGAWGTPMPDMLTGSFAGPGPGTKVADTFDLLAPEKNCIAWMWITHYAGYWTQPLEYFLSFQGHNVAQRKIPRDQLLGPEGLMEGMGGEWSPKWFDSVYAGRFSELVRLQLSDARSPIAIGNCQLSALAIAPPSAKAAMTTYVAQVQADVSRYRRQFVVGYRNDPLCELNPTEAEAKAGMILLCPPQEEAFQSGWRPRESDRAEKVSLVATGGLLAAAPVCVVPLKKTSGVSAAVGPLRTADGRQLNFEKDSPEILFCKTVPRAIQARVDEQPWLLGRKGLPVGEKQMGWMVLKVTPAADARPGLYQGAIRLSLSGTTTQVPLEVKIVPTGGDAKELPTIGLLNSGWPADYYRPLVADDMPDSARDALQQKTCQQLLESGNAFFGPGAVLSGPTSVADAGMPRFLKLSVKNCRGYTLFDCQQAVDFMRDAKIAPGTKQYEQLVGQLVSRMAALAIAGGVKDYYLVLGGWFDQNQTPDRVRLAGAIGAAGGNAALFADDAYLARTPKDQVQSLFTSVGAIILPNYEANLAKWVDAYKKARPGGRAYLYSDRPDRFGAGLFAAVVGADGAYVANTHMNGGTFTGFYMDGTGVLALDSDGSLAPTLGSLWLQQAFADFLLVRRAEAIEKSAIASQAAVPDLTKTLADLRAIFGKRVVGYYENTALRSTGATRTEVEAWRVRLLEACGKAWDVVHPPQAGA